MVSRVQRQRMWMVLAVVCLCAVLIFPLAVQAEDNGENFSDVSGHWAVKVIDKWAAQSLIGGYPDGTFRPAGNITRAEFITMVNKAFGYSAQSTVNFTDVKPSNWFAGEIAKAQAVDYIKGYQDGTMRPNNLITRQEAAAVITRIMKLTDNTGAAARFIDAEKLPAWSKGSVGAIEAAGYMGGYPDGTFNPFKPITRAESVSMLDRVAGVIYNTSGKYGPETGTETVEGNITIAAGDITLRNTVVQGTLHLTAGIGDGNVWLDNVKVTGTTVISGGGEHSVVADNNTELNKVIAERQDGKLRIEVKNGSRIGTVILRKNANLVQPQVTTNAFGEVIIEVPEGETVELAGGFDSISVQTPGVKINIATGSKIGQMDIVSGANGATVDLAAGSTVSTLNFNAAAVVSGTGSITTANVDVPGVSIEQKPEKLVLTEGTSAVVDGKEVKESTTTKPSTGGSGGDRTPPTVTGATVVIGGQPYTAYINADGKSGSIDLSKLDPKAKITRGTIKVSENCRSLTIIVPVEEFSSRDLAITQENLTPEGKDLDVIEYLKALDPEKDGVSLSKLEQVFGKFFTLKGNLVDTAGNTSEVSLTITLP